MPELTADELSALFTWMVDAQEFLQMRDEQAKAAVDKLIDYQQTLKTQAPESTPALPE